MAGKLNMVWGFMPSGELVVEAKDEYGDSARVIAGFNGEVRITVAEDWAGDSRTGLGASCDLQLSIIEAEEYFSRVLVGIQQIRRVMAATEKTNEEINGNGK